MIEKYDITTFIQKDEEVSGAVTKFGGQPFWLEEPTWPVSEGWDDRLMMFVGQIAIDEGMFGNDKKRMAYIFATQPESYEDYFSNVTSIYKK